MNPTTKINTINLKYLQTEEELQVKKNNQNVRDLIEAQRDLLNKATEQISSLGLKIKDLYIQGDDQEDWDSFIRWQQSNSESIILITPSVILGTHVKMTIIYKPKAI